MMLLFTICFALTSDAQDLLPTIEYPAEKIRSHQVKLNYLKLMKLNIEDKQKRDRQEQDPSGEDSPLTSPNIKSQKRTSKALPKRQSPKPIHP